MEYERRFAGIDVVGVWQGGELRHSPLLVVGHWAKEEERGSYGDRYEAGS